MLAAPALPAPTRSSPIAVAPDGHVFVVNPDSSSVARLRFDARHVGTLTHERPVGRYPRTLALAGSYVFSADQASDTVSRLDQADLGHRVERDLGFGCAPYGVAATPAGDRIIVSCQGTSELVLVDRMLAVLARVPLAWPNARALAVSSDGTRAYVTHYLTVEPETSAHVSVVDLVHATVLDVLAIPPDTTTCETQNSGQGVLNLVSAIALVPDGAPAAVAHQLWVAGTRENNLSKGLFARDPAFRGRPGAALFPWFTYRPFPDGAVTRDVYRAGFHDIARFAIYALDADDGHVVGKLDVDQASAPSDLAFSPDGTTAYIVDLAFNSYHIVNTRKGQAGDVTTVFASPSAFGPGGADPSRGCLPDALRTIAPEGPFRLAPQAELTATDGYEPIDATGKAMRTGVDFDAATYVATTPPRSRMRSVPDGVGTGPIGVALSPDGETAYVANYLSRNVVPVAAAAPLDPDGKPAHLRCIAPGRPGAAGPRCATDNDCPAGARCVPLVLGPPVPTIRGGIAADPLPPALLDGKILFTTAARDSSVPNRIGLATAAPRFNDPARTRRAPASVVSTAREGAYVSCATCHADFGGHDGRTWDFSQFGRALRNTMDLRGRAGFAPGACSNDRTRTCLFDAACGDGSFCRAAPAMIPPNVAGPDRERYFNPMLTVHWNGDRDEVEDFEHTYRELLGAGDCDGVEDILDACLGALVQRSSLTSSDPTDVHGALGPPNRNLRGPRTGKIVGIRLTHLADFVYSLAEFVRNPNRRDEAGERGSRLFEDPQTGCVTCHHGGPRPGREFFTDKRPNPRFDPAAPPGADRNNPFVRHDVGTANLFDVTSPLAVARASQVYHNARLPIPGDRGPLREYVSPVLDDVWNTPPYLHDGSAHTLLDVVRPCDTRLDDCLEPGRGRNLDGQHGVTAILGPEQLNDLVAFLKTLTPTTEVGPGEPGIRAGHLDLGRAVLCGAAPRTPGTPRFCPGFALDGVLQGAPVPRHANVALSLGTPAGGRMAILARSVRLGAGGTRLTGRATEGGGTLTVTLRRIPDGYRVRVRGAGLDLAPFEHVDGDLTNRDLTVALEISGTTFVRNRNLRGRAAVFRLPRRRG